MKITQDQVAHVARLARLDLPAAELEQLAGDMDAILAYVDKLKQLDTEGIEPTAHAVPMENAFRTDEARPGIGIDKATANAPAAEDGCFVVPKVIE